MKISDLFTISVAKSKGVDDYDDGAYPFITNTEINNGIVKYVEPFDEDKIFSAPAICISGLGYATLQLKDFLPKGNGGDSATILIPKKEMGIEELMYYTAVFNLQHKWRFSFGRKANKRRIQNLILSPVYQQSLGFDSESISKTIQNKLDIFQKNF
ncbi:MULTISPECIES: restriction endonuclease subunit S [Lysinibacillus]|jgi:hypothetical protein|uniref:restriction endonuclease subunit S n=1 Tax=Lysinibacillus TaxID=400634 RepID=UPI0004DA6E62|nr:MULTISPECIES: restriction endonuclease subunit S [Lysinibacillus]AJK86559.1 hypothetical protein HR49_04780 [Lysinibacillus fusiformis]KHK51457.1 hypothetical protein PI85_13865 [Lysinibacillus sp. A1]